MKSIEPFKILPEKNIYFPLSQAEPSSALTSKNNIEKISTDTAADADTDADADAAANYDSDEKQASLPVR